MLFFYVRHGDPIYNPDSLTPLGERQAEAVAKRLALYGVDKIFASTSNRAIQTAKPTCELTKKEPVLLDFANEHHAWQNLTVHTATGAKIWMFQHAKTTELINSKEMRALGDRWFDHPAFAEFAFEKEINRIYDAADAFFAELGYEHDRYTGKYIAKNPTNERVAMFAHQGFGLAFLSCVLDIPYPQFCTHFDTSHTGVTVIDFSEHNGICVPKILTLSSDAHLYREGLPTKYNNSIYF